MNTKQANFIKSLLESFEQEKDASRLGRFGRNALLAGTLACGSASCDKGESYEDKLVRKAEARDKKIYAEKADKAKKEREEYYKTLKPKPMSAGEERARMHKNMDDVLNRLMKEEKK